MGFELGRSRGLMMTARGGGSEEESAELEAFGQVDIEWRFNRFNCRAFA